MRNYGQHNALLCGIRAARNDVIVTLDDDLQNPPEEIPRLLAKLAEGYDVVYGTPQQQQHGFLARPGARQSRRLALQSRHGRVGRAQVSAFRAFRTSVARRVRRLSQPVRVDRRAADVGHDALRVRPRAAATRGGSGVSNYTLRQAAPRTRST